MRVRILLLAAVAAGVLAAANVRVSMGALTLPTYAEGPPDINPPFDQLQPSWAPLYYPYTTRTNFTNTNNSQSWRTIELESEYLHCTILPDLGGHLYTCIDKVNGHSMFYANRVIKKSWVALRGAWIATGLESNFPVGHSWVTVSPVNFALRSNPDGSGSAIVSAIDRVYGMEWRVEYILRPASLVLEQKVTLYNRSAVRRPYYWWSNGEVQVESPKTRFIMPTALVANQGATRIDTWPMTAAGVDMSVVENHKVPNVEYFAYRTNEPFLAVFNPASGTATIHYADPAVLPGKKLWSWGSDAATASSELTNDGSVYVEIQAGLMQDQMTFAFLEPQSSRSFSEYWMPARGMTGISRANLSGTVNLERSAQQDGRVTLKAQVLVTQPVGQATVKVLNGANTVYTETLDLDPANVFSRSVPDLEPGPQYRFELSTATGGLLLAHTENSCDCTPASALRSGRHTQLAATPANEDDFVKSAAKLELQDKYDQAGVTYASGLARFPTSVALLKGSGRLAAITSRYSDAADPLARASASAPADLETHYYLGLVRAASGNEQAAQMEFTTAAPDPKFGRAAGLQLALSLARTGDFGSALKAIEASAVLNGPAVRAGAVEVALLRLIGSTDSAAARLAVWRALDPTDDVLRYEQALLAGDDGTLWSDLAIDPERVINAAAHYMELGLERDALAFLDRTYAPADRAAAEPGSVLPQDYALVAYYRAYCRIKTGDSPDNDYAKAASLSAAYVFPSRPETRAVLEAAVRHNPNDAIAHALLGALYLNLRMTPQAVAAWQAARAIRKDIPALYRNLGRAFLDIEHDVPNALAVLTEGIQVDPDNRDLVDAYIRAKAASKSP